MTPGRAARSGPPRTASDDLNEVTGRERGRIYEAPRIFDAVCGPVDIGEPSPDPQLQLDVEPRS